MKKLKYTIAAAICAVATMFIVSCVDEFRVGDASLGKAPGEDMDEEQIFSRKIYTEYLLWQCYEGLYAPFKSCYTLNSGVMEGISDIIHSELGWDELGRIHYPGTQTAANANPGWVQSRFAFITQGGIEYMGNQNKRSIWNCVRDCELLIDNIHRVPDMTEAEKARFIAEARIILASKYLDGIRHFGGLPIVDHAFRGDEQLETGRSTLQETVDFAVGLLDQAIAEPNLPWNLPASDLATWAGRMTKASAIGVKIKLLHYVASPIFNSDTPYCNEQPNEAVNLHQVWFGNYDPSRWQDVIDACEQFFTMNSQNGNYYYLIQPTAATEEGYRMAYRNAYRHRTAVAGMGNPEVLVEVHDRLYFKEWDQVPGNVWHAGGIAATLDWMEMFPWADGKNYDGQRYYGQKPAGKDIFAGRDPRLYESMVVQKQDYAYQRYGFANPVQLWEGGEFKVSNGDWSCKPHGFPTYKWVLDQGSTDQGGMGLIDRDPVMYAYVRLADVHLMYAEALAELGKNAEALRQVNLVRARVGLPNIETANPTLALASNKENLIKEILRERACELGMENESRFHDMNRRKLEQDYKKQLRGMRIYRINDQGERYIAKWDAENEPFPTKFEYEAYDIVGANPRFQWSNPDSWSPKVYLAPLPPDEINKNYGLTQNPGWF